MLINPKLLCRPEPVWWVAPSPPGGLPTGSSVWGRSWLLARSWGSFPSSFYARAVCRWQRLSFLAQQLQLLCACCFSKTWAVLATGCCFSWPYLSSQGILSGLLSPEAF